MQRWGKCLVSSFFYLGTLLTTFFVFRLTPHFEVGITGGTYRFCKHDVDRATGEPVVRMTTVLSAKADARLTQVLLRASKVGNASERVEVLKFADFLTRCLALDPARRLSVRDALKHEFFIKKKKKDAAKDVT